jgi:ankyrin repeat protein
LGCQWLWRKIVIMSALDRSDYALCSVLLAQGADPNAAAGDRGVLLTHVIDRGDVLGVRLLLGAGAAVNAITDRHRPPLHAAAARGEADICLELIVRGAALEARDSSKLTALHVAAKRAHVGVCDLLLAHGADINAEENMGRTPFHKAAESLEVSAPDTCALLIARGAAPDFVPDDWKVAGSGYLTPFQWAILFCSEQIAAFFVNQRPDLLLQTTLGGESMLEIASKSNAPLVRAAITALNVDNAIGSPTGGSPSTSARSASIGPI